VVYFIGLNVNREREENMSSQKHQSEKLKPLSPAVLDKKKGKRKLRVMFKLKEKLDELKPKLIELKKKLVEFKDKVKDKLTVKGDEDKDEIQGQLEALDFAFNHKGKEHLPIRNIALTGGYGTGKSTVIETFKKTSKRKFIHIAFTHFREVEGGPDGGEGKYSVEAQILNQLVYQVPAKRIPRTRVPVKRTLTMVEQAIAALAAILIGVSLFLAFYWDFRPELENIPKSIEVGAIAVLLAVAIAAIGFALHAILRGDFRLTKIKATLGKHEVEWGDAGKDDPASLPLLNKYLAETLYVLDRVKADAIVVEDLDRGKGNLIFAQLREICRLANQRRRKPLRFIYLLKGEKFSPEDRTKFFDLIIPVTPVMHSQEKREEQLRGLLDGPKYYRPNKDGKIISIKLYNSSDKHMQDLIKFTAYFIRDLRLLKNIVNEAQMQGKLLDILGDEPPKEETEEDKTKAAPQAQTQEADATEKVKTSEQAAKSGAQQKELPPKQPDDTCILLALMIYKNLFSDDYRKFLQGYGDVRDYLFRGKAPEKVLEPDNFYVSFGQPEKDESECQKEEQYRKLIIYFLDNRFIRVTAKMLEKIIEEIKIEIEAAQDKLAAFCEEAKNRLAGQNLVNISEPFVVEFGQYKWRVLAVENGRALLISEYILETRAYHESQNDITWADCSLRKYLSGEFYSNKDKLDESFRARIEPSTNQNPNNTYGYSPGKNLFSIY